MDHLTLLLGRACSLNDDPVVGLHDPDPQRALRGALFLGVSALESPEKLLAQSPRVLICSGPLADSETSNSELALTINLCEQSGPDRPRTCWATHHSELPPDIPTEIASEVPELRFKLSGSEASIALAARFLKGLSPSFSIDC